MTTILIVWAAAIALIVGLALLLPCQGCRLRRERMRRAYEAWRKAKDGAPH